MVYTEELQALRDTVRGLLAHESEATVWKRLCGEVGVAGLLIPEEYGGLGASLAAVHVVFAELGRALTSCPLLGSAVLAAQAILAAGDEDACQRLLPGIASGTTVAAMAWAGPDGRWDPQLAAVSTVDGLLTGAAHYVLDGAAAGVLIVVARTADGLGLFEVDPTQSAVRVEPTPTMDLTRPLATVHLTGATGRHLGPASGLGHVRDVACVALAAEQAGAARRCLELTVEHTKSRHQFGRPLGSFQALKHRMADMYVLVETAESAALAATTAEDLPLAAAVAKTHCSEAFQAVAAEMIQLHGGIAITWEHDAHRYFKRAHGSAQLLGQPREHLARLTG
jgi:hypothetical protein